MPVCRHLAYLGPLRTLREILYDPPHSLLQQSWRPRRQKTGTVNADGFGVGWYADGDPIPARYRRQCPMWTDSSFADVARVTRSSALLAAVRNRSPGMPYGEEAVAPFTDGHWLFSHNGEMSGWPLSAVRFVEELTPSELVTQATLSDSTLLWALIRQRLEAGEEPVRAMRNVVHNAIRQAGGRFNLLLTNGVSIVATTYGESLYWHQGADTVIVASEPFDDTMKWHDVPRNTILWGSLGGIKINDLGLT